MKGHITVYFSLLLLVIFALLCTTIESARLGGVRIRCQSGAYLALESVFADYSLPVAREYGLLMLDKSYGTDNQDEYQSYLFDYLSYNVTANKELLLPGADFCQAAAESVSLQSEKIVGGEGGVALEKEILSHMKYAAPAGILEWAMGKLGLLDQAETVTDIFGSLSGIQQQAAKVDRSVQKMYQGMNQVKEYRLDMQDAAESIGSAVEELDGLYEDYEYANTEEERIWLQHEIDMQEHSISLQVQDLVQKHTKLLDYNSYVKLQKDQYDNATQKVKETLAVMEQEFSDQKEQLDEEMRNIVEAELSKIRAVSAGEGDYYKAEYAAQDIAPNLLLLKENIDALSPYISGGTEDLRNALDSCAENMSFYRTDRMELNYKEEAVSGTGVDVIARVKALLDSGLLGLVAENPASLSDREFIIPARYEDSLKDYSYAEIELTEQLLINEYLLGRFGNLREPAEDQVLCYELEYILKGKETDKKNLEAVAEELLLLRSGMNLIYLLGNAEKRAEAESLAILLTGFTGMYGVIKVTELLILTVWAQAEGIADVRTLFAGNRVPLMKDELSWKLSLEGLIRLNPSELPSYTQEENGLTYQDYLRLLLVKENRAKRNGRTMDVIQGVIRKKYDAGFSLEECVTELVIRTEFKAEPVFLMLPFMGGSVQEAYHIEGVSSYAY